MKAIQWIVAAVALTFIQPAQAAQSDAEIIIYRFPGVFDNGGGINLGVATAFHCTNFSGDMENIRFVTRQFNGTLLSNVVLPVAHLATVTVATHGTAAYDEITLVMGMFVQGTTAIAATSINIICTAMTIDASTTPPIGVSLRGIRFNPIPGSQE